MFSKHLGLASMLLIAVVIAFYAYDPLASTYPDKDTAARNLQYVFSGLLKVLLFCTVWALAPWKPVSVRIGTSAACGWGAIESFQESACMMSIGIQYDAPTPGLYRGLCDIVTGWPVYMGTMVLVLLIFAYQFSKR